MSHFKLSMAAAILAVFASACGGPSPGGYAPGKVESPEGGEVASSSELTEGLCRVPTNQEWAVVWMNCLPPSLGKREARLRKTLEAWGQFSGYWSADLLKGQWFKEVYPEIRESNSQCLTKVLCKGSN